MTYLRLFILTFAAMLLPFLASCGKDDSSDPDITEPAFVYNEVWQYVSDEDDEGNRDTIFVCLNSADSTYQVRIMNHAPLFAYYLSDGMQGNLQVSMMPYGDSWEEAEYKLTLSVQYEGCVEPMYYLINEYDDESVQLEYCGPRYYGFPPYWIYDLLFLKK